MMSALISAGVCAKQNDAVEFAPVKDRNEKIEYYLSDECLRECRPCHWAIDEGSVGLDFINCILLRAAIGSTQMTIQEPHAGKPYVKYELAKTVARLLMEVPSLSSITFLTRHDYEIPPEQDLASWKTLVESIRLQGVECILKFDDKLHARRIVFDNGWNICCDVGFHLYLKSDFLTIDAYTDCLRRCRKLEIDCIWYPEDDDIGYQELIG